MARPPNSWVWQHFRHISSDENVQNVQCIICNKSFKYSSRNGPTNLARHISKTHNRGQPDSAITRRPFSIPSANQSASASSSPSRSAVSNVGGSVTSSNSSNVNVPPTSGSNQSNKSSLNNNISANGGSKISNSQSKKISSNKSNVNKANASSNSNNSANTTANQDNSNGQALDLMSSNQALNPNAYDSHSLVSGMGGGNNGIMVNKRMDNNNYADPVSRQMSFTTPLYRLNMSNQPGDQSSSQPNDQNKQSQSNQSQQQTSQPSNQDIPQSNQDSNQPQSAASTLHSMSVLAASNRSILQNQNQNQQNNNNTADQYDNGALYNSSNMNLVVQALMNIQNLLHQSVKTAERSSIRIEQRLSKSMNCQRGSGLESNYELVPFADGSDPEDLSLSDAISLPLLLNIFTVFELNNKELDDYLKHYALSTSHANRQSKLFKLAKFIGCNDVEKYWDNYRRLRNVNQRS
ncbi:hypothetical protein BVG19_g2097 [[Candida] boidinii]|nr:hypothetical protein BVG19_g2097 [[Candida] boidinii]OWB48854.1 hypothetical protein B5S27_g391 [[Candida] boidinii]